MDRKIRLFFTIIDLKRGERMEQLSFKFTGKLIVTAVMLCLALTQVAFSQEENSDEVVALEDYIVTDSEKKTQILNTNASIVVLTETDIKNSGHKTVKDLLSSIPGITDVSSGWGQVFKLSVRGTAPSNGSAAGPAIYVDGTPLNTGRGYSLFNLIPVDIIEKIEVLRSPSSALYGMNAGRGVILITTKNGNKMKKDFGANVSMEYGSWNTYKGSAQVLGKSNLFDYSLAGTGLRSDGWSHYDNREKSVYGTMGYDFDGGRAQFNLGSIYNERNVRRKLYSDYAEEHPRATYQPGKDDGHNYVEDTVITSGLSVKYDKNDWLGNFSASYIQAEEEYEYQIKGTSSPSYYTQERPSDDYKVVVNGGRKMHIGEGFTNTLTFGADYRYLDFDQDQEYPNDASRDQSGDYSATKTAAGLCINDDIDYGIFNLSGGLRWNYVKYDIDYDPDSSNTDFEKKFDNELDWSISGSVALIKNSNLFASYNHSKGYESGFSSDNGNRTEFPTLDDLKPEEYNTLEVGFKHQFNEMLNYSLLCYRSEVKGKVVTYYVPDGSGDYESAGKYNAGDTLSQGLELELSGRFYNRILGYKLSYSTINAEWQNGVQKDSDGNWQDLDGKQVNSIPEYEYTAGIDIHPFENTSYGSLTIAFDVHGFSSFYTDDLNSADGEKKDAYFFNARIDYSYKNVSVYLKCTNLFDKYYFQGVDQGFTYEGRYIGIGTSIAF